MHSVAGAVPFDAPQAAGRAAVNRAERRPRNSLKEMTMHSFDLRVGRRLLALTLAVLCACSDQPDTLAPPSPTHPRLSMTGPLVVTNTSGGNVVGSLQWAVAAAKDGETVTFDPSLAGSTIVLDSSLVITDAITIEGPATRGITLKNGYYLGTVVYAQDTANRTITLRNLTLTGAPTTALFAGAIYHTSGSLVLDHVTVYDNHSQEETITTYGSNLTLI